MHTLFLIGVLQWCIEIGRIELCTKASLLSAYLTVSHEGHLAAVLHVVVHLKQRNNARLIFDPTYPEIDFEAFNYDKPPPNAPEPHGKSVNLRTFMDNDHAGEKTT